MLRPASKLSTISWWDDVTLGADLGVAGASTDDAYAAMDWLVARQDDIEKQLAARHLREGGIAMFDLSSSWVEGSHCELAAYGYSRDGRRGKAQIEYGLLTDPDGRPVAVRVFTGNTGDPKTFPEAVDAVRGTFGLRQMIMVGDRGMITSARIKALRELEGMAWITCLRAPAIKKLMADGGPLQLSLFDEQDLAEITSPDFPGERLVCCRNPVLAEERARKRQDLLAATEDDLGKIAARVAAGRLKDPDKIGVQAGKIINKRKVAKHFILDIAEGRLSWQRDQPSIAAEAATDGIYVIRTPVPGDTLDAAGTVTAYKSLSRLERAQLHRHRALADRRPGHGRTGNGGVRRTRPAPAARRRAHHGRDRRLPGPQRRLTRGFHLPARPSAASPRSISISPTSFCRHGRPWRRCGNCSFMASMPETLMAGTGMPSGCRSKYAVLNRTSSHVNSQASSGG